MTKYQTVLDAIEGEVAKSTKELRIKLAHAEGRAIRAEAKLATAREALQGWLELASHCTIEEGVCCCGDNMENHTSPMDCGHSPVDHGAYIASQLEENTRATLTEIGEGHE